MIGRAATAAAGLAALGILASGCGGGGKSPSVASLGTSATTTTNNSASGSPSGGSSPDIGNGGQAIGPKGKGNPADFVKFAHCMQKHGVNVQIGAAGKGISISGGDPNSPNFQAAQNACRKYLPGGGPKALTPAQQAQQVQLMRKLATCMRKNGVPDFPDPGADGSFSLSKNGAGSNLDPQSSTFQKAMQACQTELKGQGPLRIGIRAVGPGPGSG